MKTIDLYFIRAISNLHVGSGEGDFSVVDKQVQRDPLNDLPCIHSSGIKGALREAMETESHLSNGNLDIAITNIFGGDPKRKKIKHQQGLNNFFDGKLIALPIRSSHDFFYVATCPELVEGLLEDLKTFTPSGPLQATLQGLLDLKISAPAFYFGEKNSGGSITLEDWETPHKDFDASGLHPYLGKRIALLSNDSFRELAKELPIIARNYLENGISKNLWYEEVVPREARFYTLISRHEDNDELNTFIDSKKCLVQLGANATVGYGLCQFQKLNGHA